MLTSSNLYRFGLSSLFSLPFALSLLLMPSVSAQAPVFLPTEGESPSAPSNPEDLRPLTQPNSLLSIPGANRLMEEAEQAVNEQDYDLAAKKYQESRQILNQLTNFYQRLARSFEGINTQVSEANKTSALDAAQMRDEATYRLALVHRAKNEPELAVPLLVQIVLSQNPVTDLGQRAYQQLFELGFVTLPYPLPVEPTSASPSSSSITEN